MPRNIVVNGRFLSRRITGVERYGREILRRFTGNPRIEETPWNGPAGHVWEQLVLPAKLDRDSVLWSPANSGPVLVRNQAVTIHDLSPLEHPEWFNSWYGAWHRLVLPLLARRVRMIFTPSEYVKQKVTARLGVKQVIVTPNGVDTSLFHPNATRKPFELPSRYILFVGSLQPRKNLVGLLNAWQDIRGGFNDVWLVVAGGTGSVFRPINNVPDGERVQFLGYVEERNLPGLYAGAVLFVLPSLDEGFGLPALEAMACGTPVIVSNGGALPEVVGEAGLIYSLDEPDTLAHAMQNCLHDPALRASLMEKGLQRARQFSWQATADLIWKALNDL